MSNISWMNSSSGMSSSEQAFINSLSVYSSWFLTALSSVALLVNLYLLNCSRYLRRPIGVNLRLCVSLTASDALCALFYILTYVINILIPHGIVSNCWSLFIEVCKYSTFFASVFTLLSLALNHYVGIVYPLRRHVITPKTVRWAIVLAYLVPFTFFFLLFLLHPSGFMAGDEPFSFFSPHGCEGASIHQSPLFRWVVVLPFIFTILFLSFLYVHILVHMRQINKDPLLGNSSRKSNGSTSTRRTSNRKLLVTLVLLAGSACLGWLPTVISFLVTCTTCFLNLPLQPRALFSVFAQIVHISKLIMDAFIYASRLIEIRYAMFVFDEICRRKLRALFGMKKQYAAPPSEFTRYLSETKEHRSTRRKNHHHQMLLASPKNQNEPCAKRTSSVVVMGTTARTESAVHNDFPATHQKLHVTRSFNRST